jgi:PAS domain S-box-containing protein
LIIDEDPTLAEVFKRFLNADSYRVLTSGSEQEALFLWRSEFFNLIVLNLSLPNIDGLSLLSRIKKLSADSEVVTLSDHGDIEKAIQSFRSGAFDHLVKPIEPGMIERAIKGALEKQCREFERRNAVAEIEFKNILLEEQKNILDPKVVRSDQTILRMMKSRILTRKLFEKVIQSLPFGALLIDKEGRILACNEAQEMFSEVSKGSLLGKNLLKEPVPKELKPWEELAREFLHKECYETKLVCQRSVKNRILSITVSSFIDEKGRPINMIFLSADITSEKKIQEQIIQSEKMTAIGQLVANLAHQIRNPLAIIGSATQCCIERGGEANGLKKYYGIIYRNVQNANKIISDLLDFGRPKELEFKYNDINKILIDIYRLLKIDFSKSGIRVLRRFDRYLPKITCDKEWLKHAFFNLLINSKQAMSNGGVISIITNYNSQDQTVEIIIRDTGKGIPKEQIPNIFNPYFTTKAKGTGLGLAIVHRIINDHQGQILPESEEGKGTKMTITLPVESTYSISQGQRSENEQHSYCG